MRERGPKSQDFPVKFPVSREFGPESGSHETPSTARFKGPSTPLRISPAGSRFAHARKTAQVRIPLSPPDLKVLRPRSGFRQRAPASLTPAKRLKIPLCPAFSRCSEHDANRVWAQENPASNPVNEAFITASFSQPFDFKCLFWPNAQQLIWVFLRLFSCNCGDLGVRFKRTAPDDRAPMPYVSQKQGADFRSKRFARARLARRARTARFVARISGSGGPR